MTNILSMKCNIQKQWYALASWAVSPDSCAFQNPGDTSDYYMIWIVIWYNNWYQRQKIHSWYIEWLCCCQCLTDSMKILHTHISCYTPTCKLVIKARKQSQWCKIHKIFISHHKLATVSIMKQLVIMLY